MTAPYKKEDWVVGTGALVRYHDRVGAKIETRIIDRVGRQYVHLGNTYRVEIATGEDPNNHGFQAWPNADAYEAYKHLKRLQSTVHRHFSRTWARDLTIGQADAIIQLLGIDIEGA